MGISAEERLAQDRKRWIAEYHARERQSPRRPYSSTLDGDRLYLIRSNSQTGRPNPHGGFDPANKGAIPADRDVVTAYELAMIARASYGGRE